MSAQYPDYEGLQVVSHVQEGLQVDPGKAGLEVHLTTKPEGSQDPSHGKVWCGLTRMQAWLILAVLGVVLVGAVIGGAVGGTQSKRTSADGSAASPAQLSSSIHATPSSSTEPSSSPSSSSSSSSTASTPLQTSGIVALNCPTINNTQYTSGTGNKITYNVFCQIDLRSAVKDIGDAIAGSLNSCIDTCTSYNSGQINQTCQGVTFDANLTRYVGNDGFNCFLKTIIIAKFPYTGDNFQASALRVGINVWEQVAFSEDGRCLMTDYRSLVSPRY